MSSLPPPAGFRRDPELSESYRKDPRQEQLLERLNQSLAPSEEADWQDLPEAYPTLHVIGVPRSGTTLLTQLIARHLDVGYINNLIAAFYRAPVYGIRLSRKLLPNSRPNSYRSEFGRTSGIEEPHEFGYFWSLLLGYDELREREAGFDASIDWRRVRTVLTNMAEAFSSPVVFKSPLLGWHLASTIGVLPKTCFIRIRRDPLENALSLANYRRQFVGSELRWVSLKPRQYDALQHQPYWRQIAGQVYYLERSVTEQINRVASRNVLEIGYEELCADPLGVLQRIQALLADKGAKVDLIGDPPEAFEISAPHARDPEEERLIREAINELYTSVPAS